MLFHIRAFGNVLLEKPRFSRAVYPQDTEKKALVSVTQMTYRFRHMPQSRVAAQLRPEFAYVAVQRMNMGRAPNSWTKRGEFDSVSIKVFPFHFFTMTPELVS